VKFLVSSRWWAVLIIRMAAKTFTIYAENLLFAALL